VVNFTMQVRDRFRLTKQALESLAASGLDGMTVTILDDRSQDDTRYFVLGFCLQLGWHYVRNDTPLGTGQLRNLVIAESEKRWGRGDYLAPHDNDVFFKPGWLVKLIQHYQWTHSHGFRMLGAYGHPYHIPLDRVAFGNVCVDEVQALATQSTFMDWKTWDKYGPYCDTPVDKTCQSEDVDFTNKIRAGGYKLGVVTPHLIHATALKNTFGEPGPGWELVKAACPEGVICE
jgi:glycosyltransferase involved in cell wall biosynthesis